MVETGQSYNSVDVDTEQDESRISQKVDLDFNDSKNYWGSYKKALADYYHDFLAYKENIRDPEKSNTFIPLPTAVVQAVKSKLKSAILSTYPYSRVEAFSGLSDQANRLTLKFNKALEVAGFPQFADLVILDACIFGTGIWQVPWRTEYQNMPTFEVALDQNMSQMLGQPITYMMPAFDQEGNRVLSPQRVYDNISLENISIFDHYLPAYATSFEGSRFHIIKFRASISQLEKTLYTQTDGQGQPITKALYKNLELLKDRKSNKSNVDENLQRTKTAGRQDTFRVASDEEEFIQYTTDSKIIVKPVGVDYLIRNDNNPIGKNIIHGSKIFPISNEPYGLGIIQIIHKMIRTENEVVDVIMNQLNLEDNKNWIVADNIDDGELRAGQNNIIHIPNYDGNVRDRISTIETRAIATEIFPLINFFDGVIQKISMPNTAMGVPALGAETAYENQALVGAVLGKVEDYLKNLEATLGQPLMRDIHHLHKLYFKANEVVQEHGADGQVMNEVEVSPEDFWVDLNYRFDWAGKERSMIEERAQLTNWLQVVSQIPVQTWTLPIVGILIRMLFMTGKPMNMLEINNALEQTQGIATQMTQMEQQMAMLKALPNQTGQSNEGGKKKDQKKSNVKSGKDTSGALHNMMSQIANSTNSLTPQGVGQ